MSSQNQSNKNNDSQQPLQQQSPPQPPPKKKKPIQHLIAGGTAGFVESSVCHPLDTIKTRMQLRRQNTRRSTVVKRVEGRALSSIRDAEGTAGSSGGGGRSGAAGGGKGNVALEGKGALHRS